MLSFAMYKTNRDNLLKWMSDISNELNAYPKNEMGMTIQSIRDSQEYKSKKALYNKVFSELRALNGTYIKVYKKELAAERKAKYGV